METLRETLEQQKTFYREMRKRRGIFQCFHSTKNTNKRINNDNVLSQIRELKIHLKYSQSDLDDVKKNLVQYD